MITIHLKMGEEPQVPKRRTVDNVAQINLFSQSQCCAQANINKLFVSFSKIKINSTGPFLILSI